MTSASAEPPADDPGAHRPAGSLSGAGTSTAGPQQVVALDGPAGSGKSTVARLLAQALGWRYVDTGSSYRAATLAVLLAGVELTDREAVAAVVGRAEIVLSTDPAAPATRLDGRDVSAAVRGADVTAAVSAVSAVPAVRAHLLQLQRAALGTQGAVAEGRDVADVVAPGAAVKVYLDARAEVRAARRTADTHAGVDLPQAQGAGPQGAGPQGAGAEAAVQADLERRDALDSSRTASPLRVAADAVRLDTSDLTTGEVLDRLLAMVREAGLA